MAEGLNKVILLGNLGADPELRSTNSGTAILNIRLATTETYLDRNKERQERTEWHSVTVWGARGESLGRILSKGDRILVEGSNRTTSYEKDGDKRYKTEVVASNIVLCGGKATQEAGERRDSGQRGGSRRQELGPSDDRGLPPPGDDDIPF